jgi:hypothetical protein
MNAVIVLLIFSQIGFWFCHAMGGRPRISHDTEFRWKTWAWGVGLGIPIALLVETLWVHSVQ